MPYNRCRQTASGSFDTGLVGTIGYTLYTATGAVSVSRATAGIAEIGTTGIYTAAVSHPDNFNGAIVWDDTVKFANETINDVPSLILSTPANKLVTDATGRVDLNLAQTLDETQTGATIGGALFAGWCGWFGKKILETATKKLRFYRSDNATVAKELTVDSTTAPTSVV